jgi:DNA-binding NtrC family response regulator
MMALPCVPNHNRPTAVIVDHDALVGSRFQSIAEVSGYDVVTFKDFETARDYFRGHAPASALVVNLRLGEFNGIHLVYLAKLYVGPELRTLVYARPHDPSLAREAQRAGAFYQRQGFLPFSLAGFLKAGLPAADRRDVSGIDRRTTFRGGRRTTDIASLHFALGAD